MIIKAYERMKSEKGEQAARQRFEQSAVRILKNIFCVGLYENPYPDMDVTLSTVGCEKYVKAGYEAQKKSLILLKNKGGVLPVAPGNKVYVPKRYTPAGVDWFGNAYDEKRADSMSVDAAKKYYTPVDDPAQADFAIVPIRGPQSGTGFSRADLEAGGQRLYAHLPAIPPLYRRLRKKGQHSGRRPPKRYFINTLRPQTRSAGFILYNCGRAQDSEQSVVGEGL